MSSSYLCPQVPGISWKQVENIAEYIRGTIYSEPSKVIQRGACLRLFEGGLRIFGIEYAVQELALGEEGFYDSQRRELILSLKAMKDYWKIKVVRALPLLMN